jgi:hypothetical protein
MRTAIAAILYFAAVFGVGFLLGSQRVLWLEPRIGATFATFCEAPLLLAAIVVAARWIPGKVGMRSDLASLAMMGVGALILQQIADFTLGIALRGIDPAQQLAYLVTTPGLTYLALLLAFAGMPMLLNAGRAAAQHRRTDEHRRDLG